MIHSIDALIRNRNIHLELHLDQLLPSILTCIVAKRIGSVGDNHWLLRDEASQVLVRTCSLFGEKYGNLRGKVIQTLCKALERQGDGELGRWYGGIVGLTMFGRSVVESFVLPLMDVWVTWEKALKEKDGEILFGLERCQDAFLVSKLLALIIFLGTCTVYCFQISNT
jgi:transcription initiation factor TFIID subunit 6